MINNRVLAAQRNCGCCVRVPCSDTVFISHALADLRHNGNGLDLFACNTEASSKRGCFAGSIIERNREIGEKLIIVFKRDAELGPRQEDLRRSVSACRSSHGQTCDCSVSQLDRDFFPVQADDRGISIGVRQSKIQTIPIINGIYAAVQIAEQRICQIPELLLQDSVYTYSVCAACLDCCTADSNIPFFDLGTVCRKRQYRAGRSGCRRRYFAVAAENAGIRAGPCKRNITEHLIMIDRRQIQIRCQRLQCALRQKICCKQHILDCLPFRSTNGEIAECEFGGTLAAECNMLGSETFQVCNRGVFLVENRLTIKEKLNALIRAPEHRQSELFVECLVQRCAVIQTLAAVAVSSHSEVERIFVLTPEYAAKQCCRADLFAALKRPVGNPEVETLIQCEAGRAQCAIAIFKRRNIEFLRQ